MAVASYRMMMMSSPNSPLLFTLLFFPALLAMGPLGAGRAAATYGTQGELQINTESGPLVSRQIPFSTTVEIMDQDVSIGDAGENATAAYSVSILDVAVGASTSAQNGLHLPGNYYSATATVQNTFLQDDLTFSIPAGSYPSGLYAVARVHVGGSVGASEGANASHNYGFSFGESVNLLTTAPAPDLDTDIELTKELLVPGTTLNNPTTRLVRFTALVASHSSTPGEVAQSASSDISGELTCIDAPPAITWVSESGVFGAQRCSEALPSPSLTGGALAALALALIGSGLWITHGSRRELA